MDAKRQVHLAVYICSRGFILNVALALLIWTCSSQRFLTPTSAGNYDMRLPNYEWFDHGKLLGYLVLEILFLKRHFLKRLFWQLSRMFSAWCNLSSMYGWTRGPIKGFQTLGFCKVRHNIPWKDGRCHRGMKEASLHGVYTLNPPLPPGNKVPDFSSASNTFKICLTSDYFFTNEKRSLFSSQKRPGNSGIRIQSLAKLHYQKEKYLENCRMI